MDQPLPEKNKGKPRVLVAPLDWGLGHATRCIPIIRELLELDCEVWLAGERHIEKLLKDEFTLLPFLSLRGYHIRYARSGSVFFWKIISQLPKILLAIRRENNWLKKAVKQYKFDV